MAPGYELQSMITWWKILAIGDIAIVSDSTYKLDVNRDLPEKKGLDICWEPGAQVYGCRVIDRRTMF
jgi:hypothetical protein